MAQSHIVRHGVQRATARNFQITSLAGDQILAQQEPAIRYTMGLFQHLTLASAAGAFVHNRYHVIIRCDDLDGGTVIRYPTFAFAQPQQHPVNTFLGARTGIEIVGEQFVQAIAPVMHHDLLPIEMGMPEDGRYVDNRPGYKSRRNAVEWNNAL